MYEEIIKAREGEDWNLRYAGHLERLSIPGLGLFSPS